MLDGLTRSPCWLTGSPLPGLVTFRTRWCGCSTLSRRPAGTPSAVRPYFQSAGPNAVEGRQILRRLLAEQGVGRLPVGLLELLARLLDLRRPEQEHPEVEADGLRVREDAGQRAEPAERGRGVCLVEAADRDGDACVGVVRREAGGRGELALGGERPAELLQRGPVEQLRVRAAPRRPRSEGRHLLRSWQHADPQGRLERR